MTRVSKSREYLNKLGKGYYGNIIDVRALEDCIRATRKYTEGIRTMRKAHPIQGEELPSRDFRKYYEVYPNLDVGWDMPAGRAIDWLLGEYECIDVMFHYDYRANKASILVRDGIEAVRKLVGSIPGFGDALRNVNGVRAKGKV